MADQARRGDGRVVALPGAGTLISMAASRIAKSPKAQTFIALWMFGLFCLLYATPPLTTTEEMREEFNAKLQMSNSIPGYQDTFEELMHVQDGLYQYKTWFWWTDPERSRIVYDLQDQEKQLTHKFSMLEAERESLRRDAFQAVGLFSEYGVEEARQLFWDCLNKGKGFARRSTFYDALFGVVMMRDENLGAFVVRIILNFLINATLGLFGVSLAFLYYLYGMVFTYKASLVSGLAFFFVAGLAGLSMVFLYMFLLYGAVAGAGYALVKTATDAQIQNGQRSNRPPQQIQYRQPYRSHNEPRKYD